MWFRLPRSPLFCWGEELLSRITRVWGVLLFSDKCTTSQLRLFYARVLVEIDITKRSLSILKYVIMMVMNFFNKCITSGALITVRNAKKWNIRAQ